MIEINFSHIYKKFPFMKVRGETTATLLDVWVKDYAELSVPFIHYDTETTDGEYYQLPPGKLIILILQHGAFLFTTIRRWTPEKMNYYRAYIGHDVKLKIK